MSSKSVLLACLAATLFMTGVIWFVQLVHYPLFEAVERDAFRRYHAEHTRTTTYVVVLPMLAELLASVYLVIRRPDGVEPWMAWVGLAAALVSWGVTFLLSVPAHNRLSVGFDLPAHRTLVRTNAIRVASWTLHSLVLIAMTSRLIDHRS